MNGCRTFRPTSSGLIPCSSKSAFAISRITRRFLSRRSSASPCPTACAPRARDVVAKLTKLLCDFASRLECLTSPSRSIEFLSSPLSSLIFESRQSYGKTGGSLMPVCETRDSARPRSQDIPRRFPGYTRPCRRESVSPRMSPRALCWSRRSARRARGDSGGTARRGSSASSVSAGTAGARPIGSRSRMACDRRRRDADVAKMWPKTLLDPS